MNYYEIGQRIRKFRKAANLSQEQLAERVSISTTHLSHIETGNTKLSLPVFVEIAKILSIHTDELLYDTKELDKSSVKTDILEILDTCTIEEALIIKDIVRTTKSAFDKYK